MARGSSARASAGPIPLGPLGPRELTEADLRPLCDPQTLGFETTADLEDLQQVLGQDRAVEALRFGLDIAHEGYHLFVLGPVGVGRHRMVKRLVAARAQAEEPPSDWVYVHAFDDPAHPRAIRMATGDGVQLRADIDRLIEELPAALDAAFASDEHRARLTEIKEVLQQRHEEALEEVRTFAESRGVALVTMPAGLAVAPTRDGKVVPPSELQEWSEEQRKEMEASIEAVKERLTGIAHDVPRWESELRAAVRELDRSTTALAVAHLLDGVRERWGGAEALAQYLAQVEADILENAQGLRGSTEGAKPILGGSDDLVLRYRVNVLVDSSAQEGAPLVFEDDPTLPNLVGRVEHRAVLGALRTDHTLVHAGALHRANGGYLVLDAVRVLTRPMAWEHLKRTLRAREVRFGTVGDAYGLTSTVSLAPEPIPLELKVLLIGDPRIYSLLSALDPEFGLLFKVPVELDDRVDSADEGGMLYARLVATLTREDELKPFTAAAVAAVFRESARVAGDREKLTTHLDTLTDLLRESDHMAGDGEVVDAPDVRRAVAAARDRSARVRDRLLEATLHDTLHVRTTGAEVGQINGLSVLRAGRIPFGRPSRITARVRLGAGKVVDIEREVELGGSLHSKGVLILTGYLGGMYAQSRPLALHASIVFEQSYGGVDGDSASLAETCALLSALAEVPLRQDLGVTGSIDQRGRVQAIGGANEKVEGFFDLCAARGLSGTEGVVLPSANARHLVLREDVVEAVAEGQFHIYAVQRVDEAVELLTGAPAGRRKRGGGFTSGSVHAKVDARLEALAQLARERTAKDG